jgi:dihydroflavonol-4-reductase
MSTTLVTGATGFIGSAVARQLVERGDEVRCTVRATSNPVALEGLDVELVEADVTERQAVRRALKGVDRVFHVAGITSLRASDDALRRANVLGTRTVLGECLRAGVERVVHTSSVAAIGPAERGTTADETHVWRSCGLAYADTKHAAEAEALRFGAQGLPVVVVNPAHVLGWGDMGRSSTDVVRRFLLRRIPAYVDGTINIVDVEDVARGHVLADALGRPGERYILGDRNYTWARLFSDLARASGIEAPPIRMPFPAALALAELAERTPGPTPVTVNEVRGSAQRWAFRSTKARRELGWTTRPHEETVERTVAWYVDREGDRLRRSGRRQPLGLRLAGQAVRQIERVAP